MSVEIKPTGIPGLDLVLGGGVRLIERTPKAGLSGSLLIRGTPGAGKSLLGMQLALAIADELRGDVACGCIEILPVELESQLAGFVPPSVEERPRLNRHVLSPPFSLAEDDFGRLFAAVMDLGSEGEERQNLEAALAALLDAVQEAGGRPRVLIVDSLSDGYGIASSAPRTLADGLCKLAAERGLFLILLEEISHPTPSGWSFAVDLVIELQRAQEDSESSDLRKLSITKNRLGSCDIGSQDFTIEQDGVHVLPRPAAYFQRRIREELLPVHFPESRYPAEHMWPPASLTADLRGAVTVVYGAEQSLVSRVAGDVGLYCRDQITDSDWRVAPGADVLLGFGGELIPTLQDAECIWSDDPYVRASRLLSDLRSKLGEAMARPVPVRRVFVGDLSSLRSYVHAEEIRRALFVLALWLYFAKIPLILFETTAVLEQRGSQSTAVRPQVADQADVLVCISGWNINQETPTAIDLTVTLRRTGQSFDYSLPEESSSHPDT